MIFNKIEFKEMVIRESLAYSNKEYFNLDDLRLMLKLCLSEIPIVDCNRLVGYLQRNKLVESLLFDSSCIKTKCKIMEPDQKIYLEDDIEIILKKLDCTSYKIISIFNNKEEYLGTVYVRFLLRKIIDEKEKAIKYYETYYTSFGASA